MVYAADGAKRLEVRAGVGFVAAFGGRGLFAGGLVDLGVGEEEGSEVAEGEEPIGGLEVVGAEAVVFRGAGEVFFMGREGFWLGILPFHEGFGVVRPEEFAADYCAGGWSWMHVCVAWWGLFIYV